MLRFLSGCLVAATALLSGCTDGIQVKSPSGWIELKSQHFVLKTSLPQAEAVDTLQYLETARATMLQAAWGGSKGPPRRTEVVVFGRPKQLERFVEAYVAGELVNPPGFEPYIVFSRNENLGVPSLAAHELAHALSHWYMPLQPAWLAEGLATFLETTRVDKNKSLGFVGAAPSRSLTLKSNTGFDTAALFAAHTPRAAGLRSVDGFYAQSWLLVRYLIEEHADAFAAFQRRLAHLGNWRVAYQTTLPPSVNEAGPSLDRRLQEYWDDRANWVYAASLKVDVPKAEVSIGALPLASVHGLYGWLLVADRQRAEPEVEAALRLDPGEPLASRAKFYGWATVGERPALARQVIARRPDSVEGWLLLLDATPDAAEASHALQQALRLEPDNPRVRAALGLSQQQLNDARTALPNLHYALHTLAPTGQLLVSYVLALGSAGYCEEARRAWESHFTLSEHLSAPVLAATNNLRALCSPAPG